MDEKIFNETIEYLLESQNQLTTKIVKQPYNGQNGFHITFFDGKKEIGECSVCDDYYGSKLSFLYGLEVKKEFRGQGYGTKIVQYMIDKYNVKYLNVAKDNEIAKKLYKKFGFKRVGNVRMDNGEIMDRMERKENLKEAVDYLLESQSQDLQVAKDIAKKINKKTLSDEKDPGDNQNCKLCAWCGELQFRGENILPRPVYSPADIIFQKDVFIVKNPEKIKIQNKNSVREIISKNPGRYYCHVNWNNSKGGHEFLLISINEKIYIFDGQDGKVVPFDDDKHYFNDINYSNSYLIRLDDKEIDRETLKYNDEKYIREWKDSDKKYLKEAVDYLLESKN